MTWFISYLLVGVIIAELAYLGQRPKPGPYCGIVLAWALTIVIIVIKRSRRK